MSPYRRLQPWQQFHGVTHERITWRHWIRLHATRGANRALAWVLRRTGGP